MLVLQSERIIPPEQGIAMPEYLKFAATLWDLDPQHREARLREQAEKLEIAITRLKETERAPADLFEKIVSI